MTDCTRTHDGQTPTIVEDAAKEEAAPVTRSSRWARVALATRPSRRADDGSNVSILPDDGPTQGNQEAARLTKAE